MRFDLYQLYDRDWMLRDTKELDLPFLHIARRKSSSELIVLAPFTSSLEIHHSRFSSRSRYVYIPDRVSAAPFIERRRDISMLFANSKTSLFADTGSDLRYIGEANLGAMAFVEEEIVELEFAFVPKLDYSTWLQLGGYANWMAIINNEATKSILDIVQLQHTLQSLSSSSSFRMTLTRFEEDMCSIYVNEDQAVVTFQTPNNQSFVSHNARSVSGENEEVIFTFPEEVFVEFLSHNVVPREEGLEIFISCVQTRAPSNLLPL